MNNLNLELLNIELITFFFNYIKNHIYFKSINIAKEFVRTNKRFENNLRCTYNTYIFKIVRFINPLIFKAINLGYIKKYNVHTYKKIKNLDLSLESFIKTFQSLTCKIYIFIDKNPEVTYKDLIKKFSESMGSLNSSYYKLKHSIVE